MRDPLKVLPMLFVLFTWQSLLFAQTQACIVGPVFTGEIYYWSGNGDGQNWNDHENWVLAYYDNGDTLVPSDRIPDSPPTNDAMVVIINAVNAIKPENQISIQEFYVQNSAFFLRN